MDLPHLRGMRMRAVLSQEQLAERSGVARDTISKLETGRRKAYPTTIRKLAAGLEVEPRLLLGGVEYLDAEQAENHETFSWPSTEAPESTRSRDFDLHFQSETLLHKLGYRITGSSRRERWRILITKAIPELGLQEVAETIASHCRNRKQQNGGREKYAHAIAEWEHDLARLKKTFNPEWRSQFSWPSTELYKEEKPGGDKKIGF